jgi:FkbM family methyltransferase
MIKLIFATDANFYVPARDLAIGRALEVSGEFCRAEVELLAELYNLKPGGLFLDVGANIGVMSIGLAKRIPTAQIKSFEASRAIFQLLAANVITNDIRFDCHNCLVGQATELAQFPVVDFATSGNFGDTSVATDGPTEAVLSVRLDDVIGDRQISLIKIDVEGAESAVLRGAEAILRKSMPAVLFESTEPHSAMEICREIFPNGYKFGLFFSPWLLPNNPKGFKYPTSAGDWNVVCVQDIFELPWGIEQINPREHLPVDVSVDYLGRFTIASNPHAFAGRKKLPLSEGAT